MLAPSPPGPLAPPSTGTEEEARESEPELDGAGSGSRGAPSDAERWAQAVEAVRQASPRHGKSLSYARFLGFTAEGARVAFSAAAAFHRAQVVGMSRSLVEEALGKALGAPTKLIEETDPKAFAEAPRSIAEVEASDRATRERLIEQKVREHPATRAILRHLGGTIEHVLVLEPSEAPATAPAAADEGTEE